jgi:hypothetical protein
MSMQAIRAFVAQALSEVRYRTHQICKKSGLALNRDYIHKTLPWRPAR